MRIMKFQKDQQVEFRYWKPLRDDNAILGKIIDIDHYTHFGKPVSLYIVQDQYGKEHRVFESEIL